MCSNGKSSLNKSGKTIKFPKKSVKSLFEKKYNFHGNWTLPSVDVLYTESAYTIQTLQEFKHRLNGVKSKLNGFKIEEWSEHTKRCNPAGKIIYTLKSAYNAEFVTQAWTKFYECLSQYRLVNKPKLNSVHLCEAPGAFIAALNHYLHTNYEGVEWKWLSSTLNPYYEGNTLGQMIIDDRFILHTLQNWCFGKDFTGDIMNIGNIDYIYKMSQTLGRIDLVTADGSIDCMIDPEEQELIVSPLHYAEVCAALRILSPEGSMVLKIFTIFECSTVNLLYLLNCIFRKVGIFKPATSKAGNSEVYVICVKFLKNECLDSILERMLKEIENPCHFALFPLHCIPQDFLNQIEACARHFMNLQIWTIEKNIQSFMSNTFRKQKRCKDLQTLVNQYYIKYYNIHSISEEDKVVKNTGIPVYSPWGRLFLTGSYSERFANNALSTSDKKNIYEAELLNIKSLFTTGYQLQECEETSDRNEVLIYCGKPVCSIQSSLFVNIHLLQLMNKVLQLNSCISGISACIRSNSEDEWLSILNIEDYFKADNFSQIERQVYQKIMNLLLSEGMEKLELKYMPFLTHFSVSFINYLWSNVFEKMAFQPEFVISFTKLRKTGTEDLKLLKDQVFSTLELTHILNFIHLRKLHGNNFSKLIIEYNNQVCLSYFESYLNCV